MTEFDVAVIGGGVAGLATAIALQRSGLATIVVERGRPERRRISEILVPEIKPLLAELGVCESFLALDCPPALSRLSAWGSDRLDEVDSIFNAYGHGWVVEKAAFERVLAEAAAGRGARIDREARLHAIERACDRICRLDVRHRESSCAVTCRFVVVATGRASSVRRGAADTRVHHDRLVALTVRVPRPPGWPASDHRPLVEAAPQGWWFSVLSPDGQVDLAMMTDADLARDEVRWAGARSAMLRELLAWAPHTSGRLDSSLQLAPVTVLAASSSISKTIAGEARLHVGDAAWSPDPLAGQGSYAAIAGGIQAATTILDHFRGGPAALQRYASEARAEFSRYLVERSAYYRMERRWPDAPFWRRRHAAATAMP